MGASKLRFTIPAQSCTEVAAKTRIESLRMMGRDVTPSAYTATTANSRLPKPATNGCTILKRTRNVAVAEKILTKSCGE